MYYVGVMSGTSLDGIDTALVHLTEAEDGSEQISLAAHGYATFDEPLKNTLEEFINNPREARATTAWRLEARLSLDYVHAINDLLIRWNGDPKRVLGVGCHGQTVWHEPDADPPLSIQLVDGSIVAEGTGITTVVDFRRRDLAAGGQGAPLAPAFHHAAFASDNNPRAIVNIGGIANVSLLQARRKPVLGYDTGPGNTLLDLWYRRHHGGVGHGALDRGYDQHGNWARTGEVIEPLLSAMLDDPYFRRAPPKSTGREYFNEDWLATFAPQQYRAEDVQRTLVQLTAHSVAQEIKHHLTENHRPFEVYLCGGGAHNATLMESLRDALAPAQVGTTADLQVDPDWVEAAAFAWLAARCLARRSPNLSSVTGARHETVLGAIYPA